MTQLIVHDTITELETLFTTADHPKARLDKALATAFSDEGVQGRLRADAHNRDRPDFGVMQAAQQDGYDAVNMQQGWGLFNPIRSVEVSRWQFETFRNHDVLGQIKSTLNYLTESIAPPPALKTIHVNLVPADPANRSVMAFSHGLSVYAGFPGLFIIQLHPTQDNRNRLDIALTRAYLYNIRQAQFEMRALHTLGDWIAMEGLAANLVRRLHPDSAPEPWRVIFEAPPGWSDELTRVAALSGYDAFNDMPSNIYGNMTRMGPERAPRAQPMDAEEFAYAREVIIESRRATDANHIAACLYGDEVIAPQGHPTVGLPPYAGFAVADQVVTDVLAAQNRNGVEQVYAPSAHLLAR